jgi:hypothetical protein
VRTALNVEKGMELLRISVTEEEDEEPLDGDSEE